ncbi:acetylxylan esterase [Coraliomargarita parva]|uniref:acetylxylan esterase n=1 Tax=Coraliomargarita parva TaxID=3014050 RepID=UPI0022B37618|nr:acetylxylan esterase [Coraliomargarita parva]
MAIDHDFDFDPTYGYTLEELLQVGAPDEPEDYTLFWEGIHARALDIPLKLSCEEVESPNPDYKLFEIEYDSWGNVRAGGWLTVPVDGKLSNAVVVGHGYGGREAPDFGQPVESAACIYPCARGFHRSAHPDYPGEGHQHVMLGLEDRATYSHLGSVVDYWLAASAVLELYPQLSDRLFYSGGSFGGGIGALMLAWDKRFKKAYLNIPSFGNHPLRVQLPCVGSGQAIQEHYHAGNQDILKVLQYFDAATAAQHVTIPVFVAAATFDPAVPPPGQFAVYNALAGPKELFIRQAAHFDLAGNEHDDAAVHTRLRRWFRD